MCSTEQQRVLQEAGGGVDTGDVHKVPGTADGEARPESGGQGGWGRRNIESFVKISKGVSRVRLRGCDLIPW